MQEENIQFGCSFFFSTDVIPVDPPTTFEIIDYPRFFTPNSDNVNNQWRIVGGSSLDNAQVSIFNRFGKLIRTLAADESWDGTFNGNSLPASDYWFSIAYERDGEPKVFNAHFTLKR